MAIIITDIHGNIRMAQDFLAYSPNERHICLGDLTDARPRTTIEQETECLDLLLASDVDFVWGNHDLGYLNDAPWPCFGSYGEMAFRAVFEKYRGRFSAAIAVDGWLLTHAGVSQSLAKLIPADSLRSVESVASWLPPIVRCQNPQKSSASTFTLHQALMRFASSSRACTGSGRAAAILAGLTLP